VLLFNTLTISNENTGLKNISNKDINSIKSNDLKQSLIDYTLQMDNDALDVINFNKRVEQMPGHLFQHFQNINFDLQTIDHVISIDKLKEDNQLINYLNLIIYERKIYLNLLEMGFFKPTYELIDAITAEIDELE
jgi:hypothetical protein